MRQNQHRGTKSILDWNAIFDEYGCIRVALNAYNILNAAG